jgi:hypothetical protein
MAERLIENTREPMRHPWPADCFVQGGGSGVVFRRQGEPYRTAFVEAFPAGTFLRGEGKTIAGAEDSCWAQFQVLSACAHDQGFDRRHYDNGGGYCRACGTWFGPSVTRFEPLPSYYERSSRPSTLMERAFAGEEAAVDEVLGTVGRADQLPGAPDA